MDDIAPCPLCGGEAMMELIAPHQHNIATFMPDYEGGCVISCGACALAIIRENGDYKAECVAAWNRRPASTPPGDAQRLQNGGRFPAAALQSTPQPVAAEVGGRPSPRALHEAFYERTFLALTPREFDVMAKIEDRAHAIDRGNSHAG